MKKLLIILGLLIALLTVALTVGWLWLTDTRSGAEWALNRGAGHVENLQWESLEGNLAGGLVIRDLEFEQAGTRITVERLELAARMRLLAGPVVDVRWVRAYEVDARLAEPQAVEPKPSPVLPDLTSPVPVNVRELLVDGLDIHPPTAQSIRVDRVSLAGRYGRRLELDNLTVATPDYSVEGRGHWGLSEPFTGDLSFDLATAVAEATEQRVTANFSGRLAALDLSFHTDGPAAFDGEARLRGLPGEIAGNVSLEGHFAGWPGVADLSLSETELRAEGNPRDWSVTASSHVTGMDLPPGEWWLSADGDLENFNIRELRGDILDGTVTASGELAPRAEPFSARADVQIKHLDFSSLYPEWPDQARVNGELAVQADGDEIRLDRLDISAPPTSLRVTGEGRIVPADDQLALDLDWQDLTWPPLLEQGEPVFSSQSGSVRLSGKISDWRMELEALLQSRDLPAAELDVKASGDADQAQVERLSLTTADEGRISASGRFQWQPARATNLELELVDLDPGFFVAQLPGQVNALINLRARENAAWEGELDLVELEGQVRGHAVSGSGALRLTGDQPESARLQLGFGENTLAIDSDDGSRWTWQVEAGALDQIWPGLDGAADLAGTLYPFARQIDATVALRDIAYDDISLGEAFIEGEVDWGEHPEATITAGLQEVDLRPWERLDQVSLALEGDCDSHRLTLNVSSQRGSLDIAGAGMLDNCLNGPPAWRGHIDRLLIGETLAGSWRLDQPLPLAVADDRINAGPACLHAAGAGAGRLCLESLAMDDTSQARVSITEVPADLLLMPLDPVFSLTMPLSGDIGVDWNRDGLTRLSGHLQLDRGAIQDLGDDRDLLTIHGIRLDFTPEPDRGVVLDMSARLEGDSELHGQAHIIDLHDLAGTQIDAGARLDLPDIGAFNHFVTELDRLGGRLTGTLEVSGALTAPEINGRISLHEGHLAHAPLGLEVTNIALDLEGATNRAQLKGQMTSGDGTLSLDGSLERTDAGWTTRLDLDGQSFAFADVDWLRVTASPAIRVEGRPPDELAIEGDIHINRLRAGLPPGMSERVTVSDDVEVLGEDKEDEERVVARRRVTGQLGIDLGKDARMNAAGLQTRLAGAVELLWEGNPMPRGRGVIQLREGSYRAYGQNLEIRDGEVLFTGRPLDNPRLDVRAVRDIFGDPRVEGAGVHIHGGARDPQIDLFTHPPTSEEKALAYIVTGSNFDYASGQGAINVGFYLMPRLFVSYGIGLFEAGNVLSGRYELSQRWGIRVISGERDTGVDLSYGIDR